MPPDVKLLFGPMLIGAFLNSMLFGVLVLQMFIYYRTYRRDSPWLRYFILYLFILETVNTAADMWLVYQPLVEEYALPSATQFFPWMLAADPVITVLISTPIQIFIAWRIMIISRSKPIPVIICVLGLVAFAGAIWLTVTVIRVRQFSRKPDLHNPALVWLLASAVADVVITSALVYSLSQRKTGIDSTDGAIDRIVKLTIQTGLVTAIFATLDVIFFLAIPHSTLNFTFDFSLSKLYSNALLSTLNARISWNVNASGFRSSAIAQDNVLFGHEDSRRQPGPLNSTVQTGTNFDVEMSSNFGMETTKSDGRDVEWMSPTSDYTSGSDSPTKSRTHDLEVGINVIREVRAL
jgi:hypothetical protein